MICSVPPPREISFRLPFFASSPLGLGYSDSRLVVIDCFRGLRLQSGTSARSCDGRNAGSVATGLASKGRGVFSWTDLRSLARRGEWWVQRIVVRSCSREGAWLDRVRVRRPGSRQPLCLMLGAIPTAAPAAAAGSDVVVARASGGPRRADRSRVGVDACNVASCTRDPVYSSARIGPF